MTLSVLSAPVPKGMRVNDKRLSPSRPYREEDGWKTIEVPLEDIPIFFDKLVSRLDSPDSEREQQSGFTDTSHGTLISHPPRAMSYTRKYDRLGRTDLDLPHPTLVPGGALRCG